jgi:hypothetical protein
VATTIEPSVPLEQITRAILILRGHRVLLDAELAILYGVTTKRFNEQVRRNRERFPADFMFQLSAQEAEALRSQIATSNALPRGRGGRRYLPYAFTEHGAIMAASILNSSRAVEVSVYVVRAFVQLRELLASNKELARRFAQLETRLDKKLFAHDEAIAAGTGNRQLIPHSNRSRTTLVALTPSPSTPKIACKAIGGPIRRGLERRLLAIILLRVSRPQGLLCDGCSGFGD